MAKRSTKKTAAKKPAAKKTAGRGSAGGGSAGGGSAEAGPGNGKAAAGALPELSALREEIDTLDRKIVSLLNERARVAMTVGKVKRAKPDGARKIYASDREALLLDKLLGLNAGPLPDRTVEAIYREIMSGSIALEQPVRIGFLGPAGSHSHDAAIRHFGRSVDLVYEDVHTIAGVFEEVERGNITYGLVPIENSTGGGIVDTLDAFLGSAGRVSIYAEVQIEIHHCLLAACDPSEVERIYSKPDVFKQCKRWLGEQMVGRELIDAPSSSRAVQIAVKENESLEKRGKRPTAAAIGNRLAGDEYGLGVVFSRIEDRASNITRFFVIGHEKAGPTGDDKTSVMFTTEDRPGALVEVLNVFQAAGINLSHIDKRPSGRDNWTYTFFVDALGHRDDEMVARALARVAGHCKEMHVLGSYPRSKRIL